jgi:kynurenine formamidase
MPNRLSSAAIRGKDKKNRQIEEVRGMRLERCCALALLLVVAPLFSVGQDQGAPWYPSEWGPSDQRGAANLLTPAKLREAIQLIKEGKIYQLGRVYEEGMPTGRFRSYKLHIPLPLGPAGKNDNIAFTEYLCADIGQVGTQLDGLGHGGIGNLFYNGFDRREFARPWGLEKLGIENVGVFFSRGVLIDVAAYKGVGRLEKGYEITVEDLTGAMRREGVSIRPGDIVLLHTGWGSLWMKDNALFLSGEPGIGVPAAKFLVDQKIVMVGADSWGTEKWPLEEPDVWFPVHQFLLAKSGVYNLENLDTSELAGDKVYEFAFIFAPLKLKGATGSPGNPIAVR